jgi:hypothetical protein
MANKKKMQYFCKNMILNIDKMGILCYIRGMEKGLLTIQRKIIRNTGGGGSFLVSGCLLQTAGCSVWGHCGFYSY